MTALVIFKGNFYTDLSGFLDYIVVWLGPWFGIFIVDYLLRRGRYDVQSLAAKTAVSTGATAGSTGRRCYLWEPACSRR